MEINSNSDLNEWTLDGSDSIDTANDLDGLRCVWKINFRTIYEGCERTLVWPEDDTNDTLLLTLEVIDDDDDFSTITVEISRSDQGNDFPNRHNRFTDFDTVLCIFNTLFQKDR